MSGVTVAETKTPIARREVLPWYCWLILVLGALAAGSALVPFWMSKPEYQDRFLLPLASLWLIWRDRERWQQTPSAPSRLGSWIVILSAFGFALGWNLQVQVGVRTVLLWWLCLSLLAAMAGMILSQFGWQHLRRVAFPLLFCLLALPTPARILVPMQLFLKELATRVAATALPACGIPVTRSGFILHLPSGDLGVAEACSGIRSITALVAVALLLSYLRGLFILRAAGLLGLTLLIVIINNGARIVATGILQETLGPGVIHGSAHDVLGTATVLISLGLIVACSRIFRLRPAIPTEAGAADQPTGRPRGFLPEALGLSVALMACIWVEGQYQRPAGDVRLANVSSQLGEWNGEEAPVTHAIQEMLTFDQALHRIYRDPVGHEVHLWVLYWSSTAHMVNTAETHHPDICWPTHGWSTRQRATRQLSTAGRTTPVPASVRHYEREGRQQLILYWSQQGGRFEHEESSRRPGDKLGQGWVTEFVFGNRPLSAQGHLSVLMGTEVWGTADHTERVLEAFARRLLPELYQVFPWDPPNLADQVQLPPGS